MATAAMPVISSEPEIIKVTVVNETPASVTISSGQTVGTMLDIIAYLPSRAKRDSANYYVQAGYMLNDTIYRTRNSISAEEWAMAIAKEIACRKTPGPASVTMAGPTPDTYMAMGDAVYKLTPVAVARTTKALQVVRRKLMETAQIEIDRYVKISKDQADKLLASASIKYNESARHLDAAKRAGKAVPPNWVLQCLANDLPLLKLSGSVWHVGFYMAANLTRFYYKYSTADGIKTRYWDSVKPEATVNTLLWLPLDEGEGEYNYRHFYVDAKFYQLPHITHSQACMGLGSYPTNLKTYEDWKLLRESMTRCLREVDLSSLYTAGAYWNPILQDTLPATIKKAILATGRSAENFHDTLISAAAKPTKEEVIKTAEAAKSDTWIAA